MNREREPLPREVVRARREKRKAEKREMMLRLGAIQAQGKGTCAVEHVQWGKRKDESRIIRGQFLMRLPDAWRPESRYRYAHYSCLVAFANELSEASGKQVTL